ncbi:MAG TPA: hypothetical protein VEW48_26855 [Thermoanaerobaculia bacterium]|nr:hypothetical protein [Thermoanaerobaculia bacterium]
MADGPLIDLTKKQKGEASTLLSRAPKLPTVDRTDPYSLDWAKVVKPVTWALLALLAAVMLLPFVLISTASPEVKVVPPAGTPPSEFAKLTAAAVEAASVARTKDMLDWAKTVLPSVVGFASAMVGYYFGTRASQGEPARGGSQEQPPAPPAPPNPPDGQDNQGAKPPVPPPPGGKPLDLTGEDTESDDSSAT